MKVETLDITAHAGILYIADSSLPAVVGTVAIGSANQALVLAKALQRTFGEGIFSVIQHRPKKAPKPAEGSPALKRALDVFLPREAK